MYKIWLSPTVHEERKDLPGAVRQRIKQAIDNLADNPRPGNSRALRPLFASSWEARRLRLDLWRVIYAVRDGEQQIAVLAIRKRPPYQYGDLEDLLSELD